MNRLRSAGVPFRIEGQRVLQYSPRVRSYHPPLLTAQTSRKPFWSTASDVLCFSRGQLRFRSYEQKAKALNQEGIDQQLHDYDANIAETNEKQKKAPWHREGSEDPPVRRQRSASAMTKGKLDYKQWLFPS